MDSRSGIRTEMQTAAIIVAFGPDPFQISRLIGVLARECEAVYVMDNGGGRDAISLSTEIEAVMHIVDMGGNRGLGEALNRGFRLAAAAGFDYVTTFDQDSEPAPGQVKDLVSAIQELKSTGRNVAAVGPRIVDRRHARLTEHSFMRRRIGWPIAADCAAGTRYIESDFLITSGALISVAAYEEIGEYDANLFVDYTDMEWCFRALTRGYRLYGICAVTMSHELSSGMSARVFAMTILNYSPIRRYYYARNALLLCRRSHVALGWRARLLAGLFGRVLLLPIAVRFSRGWTSDWLMLIRGMGDGLMGISGPIKRSEPSS
jgi:rhamnosyltransferase